MLKREETPEISESKSGETLISVTIARAITTLFAVRPKKLHDFFSGRTSSGSQLSSSSLGSLEESVCLLKVYVDDALERNCNLDELLLPLIQHWLWNRDMKHGGQTVLILDWLFQNESLFRYGASNFAGIIFRKDDKYIRLGWCILARVILGYENLTNQYTLNGLRDNHVAFVSLLCTCIPKLSQIVHEGSILDDGVELPSRLSLSAADCLITLSVALTKRTEAPNSQLKFLSSQQREALQNSLDVFEVDTHHLLWSQLDELIALLQMLHCWSKKRWTLHAVGVERVRRWLQDLKKQYGSIADDQSATNIQRRGWLLLSSCWKHYGILLHLEDRKFSKLCNELLDQYIAGIQHYSTQVEERIGTADDAVDTRKFFLNCICLLLGRFDGKKLETVISENKMHILQVILTQLHSLDDDLVAAAVSIFKAIILNPESFGGYLIDSEQANDVFSLLLDLLDERDETSHPLVHLISEYCSTNIDKFLKRILDRLYSNNERQKRNAVHVLSELCTMGEDLGCMQTSESWLSMVSQLIACLSDDEEVNREHASNVLAKMQPTFVLPKVFQLTSSPCERVKKEAFKILKRMLSKHGHDFNVIRMLIQCMSSRDSSTDNVGFGLKRETETIYTLILDWSENVDNWETLIPLLLEMMFSEPENAAIVRFMSYIREHLAEASDFLMSLVLSQMKTQNGLGNTKRFQEAYPQSKCDLFDRLSPLLVIRLLPLRIFDNLESAIMYDKALEYPFFLLPSLVTNSRHYQETVVGCLLNRALNASEYDEVRKLAAELCGRIHPKVLIPIVLSSLDHATITLDTTMIRSCLFSVCTSLTVRGREAVIHSSTYSVITRLEKILHLPTIDADEVFKAQHGCIDCLALIICTDMQTSTSSSCFVLDYVLRGLASENQQESTSLISNTIHECGTKPLPFRLCMANVLISVCQKISDPGRQSYSEQTLPYLIQSLQTIAYPDARAATIQVLFSAVYHLKSAIIPFSASLFDVSLDALTKDSIKERMAAAKLMAALMAADEAVLLKISDKFLKAASVLSNLSSSDADDQLRQLCRQLLSCLRFN